MASMARGRDAKSSLIELAQQWQELARLKRKAEWGGHKKLNQTEAQ
jgi:hypothetical protein